MSNNANVMTVGASVTKTQTSTVFIPDAEFPVIDPTDVAKQINLLEEAKQLGEKNLPPQNQPSRFGTAEMKIDTEIQRVVAGYQARATARVEELDAMNTKAIVEGKENVIQTRLLPKQFKEAVRSYLNDRSTEYQEARSEYVTTAREYEKFRKENQLERTCNIRTTGYKSAAIAAVIICMIIEGIINSSLFATNLEGGLLQGFINAFIASGINVGISFCLGYCGIRYVNHVSKRWVGRVCLGVFICLSALIGLLVAHYRDALQIPLEELLPNQTAERIALQTFLENPFGLSDIYSWMLLLLTLVCGIAACFDGYRFDDPYPGFSSIAKKYYEQIGIWADIIEDQRLGVNELKDKFLNLITENIQVTHNTMVHAQKTFHSKKLTLNAYQLAHRSADKAFQSLVSEFRSENSKYRNTPVPAYFSERVRLDLDASPSVPSKDFTLDLEELERMINVLRDDSENIREEIIQAFNEQDAKLLQEKEVIYA